MGLTFFCLGLLLLLGVIRKVQVDCGNINTKFDFLLKGSDKKVQVDCATINTKFEILSKGFIF